jgi:hypothetical protein
VREADQHGQLVANLWHFPTLGRYWAEALPAGPLRRLAVRREGREEYEHEGPFVDLMLIADHRSVDRSPQILRLPDEEGLPLSTRSEPSPIHRQWQVMTSSRSPARIPIRRS